VCWWAVWLGRGVGEWQREHCAEDASLVAGVVA